MEKTPRGRRSKDEEQEVRELVDFLRVLARTLGFNDTALARKSNIPLTTYLRTLKGENDPKMSVVFAMVNALGLSIREFFELAYPGDDEPSAARVQIERALGRVRGQRPSKTAPEKPAERVISVADVERIFDRLRAELVQGEGVSRSEASVTAQAPSSEGGRR